MSTGWSDSKAAQGAQDDGENKSTLMVRRLSNAGARLTEAWSPENGGGEDGDSGQMLMRMTAREAGEAATRRSPTPAIARAPRDHPTSSHPQHLRPHNSHDVCL